MSERKPTAAELLKNPDALLTSSHLAELGLSRAAIDCVWAHCEIVHFPGLRRKFVHVADYLAFVEQHTFRNDRVLPT